MQQPALEMRSISKSFPGVKALDNVSLQVAPGELLALMGENGAGKSTLMKILMGIYDKDAGEILVNGKHVDFDNPHDALIGGIAMIHQELAPVMDMTVAENIYLGNEPRFASPLAFPFINKKAMKEGAQKLIDAVGVSLSPNAVMRSLSVAQMQMVEMVRAVSFNAKVIIMDEPTSALTDKEADLLFKEIRSLKQQGVAIIYISHKMEEIFELADSITVLRDGKHVGSGPATAFTKDSLIELMVDRPVTDLFPHRDWSSTQHTQSEVLTITNLTREPYFRNISLSVKAGEIVGLSGLVGAGRSEFVETVFGLYPKESGEILVHGKPTNIAHPHDAIASGIALVTEDRKQTGLIVDASIRNNVSLVKLSDFASNGFINKREELANVIEYTNRLNVKTPSINTLAQNLSGGNQQKVVLAKWLLARPEIIILDEPTRGIDVGAKQEIYLLINELANQGKAVIVISSEMVEIVGMCDRVCVLAAGDYRGELVGEDITQPNIMALTL